MEVSIIENQPLQSNGQIEDIEAFPNISNQILESLVHDIKLKKKPIIDIHRATC